MKESMANTVRDLPKILKPSNTVCRECVMGKKTKNNHKRKTFTSKGKLDLVHTDLCGSTRTKSYYGERYFILFVDDFSTMMSMTYLREKSEAFDKFKLFKEKVENELGLKIKCSRSDIGGEFTSYLFNSYCEEHGIKRQTSTPRTPQQNGIAERRNRTILDAARTMLIEGNVSHVHWREVFRTIVYTLNRIQIRDGTCKTLYELWFDDTPTVKYFRIFGRKCYIKRDDEIGKFDARSCWHLKNFMALPFFFRSLQLFFPVFWLKQLVIFQKSSRCVQKTFVMPWPCSILKLLFWAT